MFDANRSSFPPVAVPHFTQDVPAAPNTESAESAAVTDIQFQDEWGGGGCSITPQTVYSIAKHACTGRKDTIRRQLAKHKGSARSRRRRRSAACVAVGGAGDTSVRG